MARKEGRFLCQLFVESHTFSDQARRSLRRRLSPTPLMSSMKPTARQPAFAPVPDIDLTASWLVAAAGICSDLSVTPNLQHVAAESAADQSGTFIADIKFQFHPETSVAYTMSPDRGAVEIGDDGVVVGDKAYTAVDVLTAAVWDLKNIALLEPTSSCGDPPAGSQDEWAISVFKVNTNDKCGAECVLYSGRVSSSSLDSFVQKKGRFPCQLYVDSKCSGVPKDTRCNKDDECAAKFPDKPICQTRGCNYCTAGKQGDKCWADSECAQGFQCKDETCKAWDTCTAKGDSIVIAHGANLKETVDWSLNQGANGIEMDIHFDTYTGQPTEFHHGAPCDCTFSEPVKGKNSPNMCELDLPVCKGSTDAGELLYHVAWHDKANQLALLYMDSKTDDFGDTEIFHTGGGSTTPEARMKTGGAALAQLLLDTVFGSTSKFNGVVNFGSPGADSSAYMESAIAAFNRIAPEIVAAGRVVFGYDMDGPSVTNTVLTFGAPTGPAAVETIKKTIGLGTPWRVYNNGVTVGLPFTFENAMLSGAANYAKGVLSTPPGIWTLDSTSSMVDYIRYGVGSIMTNEPKTAISAFFSMGKCLAKSDWRPKKTTSNTAVEWKFDSGSCCLGAISDADFEKGGFDPKWRDDFSDRCRAPKETPRGEYDCTPCSIQGSGTYCKNGQVCERKNLENKCRDV